MQIGRAREETAKLFMADDKVGWIDPVGDVHLVELFHHLAFFHTHADAIPDVYALWRQFEEENSQRQVQAWSEAHRGEHPAWHDYDERPYNPDHDEEHGGGVMMTHILVKAVYASGWGRVGTTHLGTIEVECGPRHERALRRKAKEFANLVGRELVVRVADMEWVDAGGYFPDLFGNAVTVATSKP